MEAADDGGHKRGRVMLDACEELQLRGELWRSEVAARGREGCEAAYSIGGEPDAATAQERRCILVHACERDVCA